MKGPKNQSPNFREIPNPNTQVGRCAIACLKLGGWRFSKTSPTEKMESRHDAPNALGVAKLLRLVSATPPRLYVLFVAGKGHFLEDASRRGNRADPSRA